MRASSALGQTWSRTCLLVSTSVIVFVGLYVLAGSLFESGHERLGTTIGCIDWIVLLMAFLLGPAWVEDLSDRAARVRFHRPTSRAWPSGRDVISRTT